MQKQATDRFYAVPSSASMSGIIMLIGDSSSPETQEPQLAPGPCEKVRFAFTTELTCRTQKRSRCPWPSATRLDTAGPIPPSEFLD
jgi:hypothetical protein